MRLASTEFRPSLAVALTMAAAALYGWAQFATAFFAPGAIGPNFNAPGSDWMVFHAAARATLTGHMADIFDGDRFTALLNAQYKDVLTEPLPYRPWVYPPSFLLLALPFGAMGFYSSYFLFQLLSGGALYWALRPRAGENALPVAALLCPAAAITVIDGQLAFFTAAVIIGGFRLIGKRPYLAGAVLGLLTLKPQLALMAPVALLAMGAWRPLLGAAASAAALALAGALAFGLGPWAWWISQAVASMVSPDPKWIEYGRIWGNSVYTCIKLLGAPDKLASLAQLAAIFASAAAVFAAYRTRMRDVLKLAVLLVATILAAPHSGAYDAVMLAVAGLLWIRGGAQESWRWAIVVLLWFVPIFSPPALAPMGRLLPFLLVGFIVLLLREGGLTLHFPAPRKATA